jgi:hypothetical protein
MKNYNMSKNLEKKISELQPKLFAEFTTFTKVDLLEAVEVGAIPEVERSIIDLEDFIKGYKEWLKHKEPVFISTSGHLGDLAKHYLKADKKEFDMYLVNDLKGCIQDMNPYEVTDHINQIAVGLIIRSIEIAALGRMIALSENS